MRATPPDDKLQAIRQQLIDGRISPDTLSRRLSRILEDELARGHKLMDTQLIRACEELLWELESKARQLHSRKVGGRRRLKEGMAGQTRRAPNWGQLRLAAVALSLVLIVGGSFVYRMRQPKHQQLKSDGFAQGTPLPIQETVAITLAPSQGPTMAPTEAPTPSPSPEPEITPSPVPTMNPATPTPIPGPKYLTLGALGAPDRWTQSYTVQGREIVVDVPVIVPAVSEVPVLTVNWIKPDQSGLRQALQDIDGQRMTLSGHEYDRTQYLRVFPDDSRRSYVEGPSGAGAYGNVPWRMDEPAENNPFTADQPLKLLRELASKAGYPGEQIVLDNQAGSGPFYQTRNERGNQPRDPMDAYPRIDFTRPLESHSKGYYRLSAAQMLGGLKLFPGGYYYGYLNEPGDVRPIFEAQIVDRDDFDMSLRGVTQTGVRERDLPLAGFDRVKASIEQRIEQGLVIELHSVELGYMLYYAQYPQADQTEDAPLLAVPVWRVQGLFLSHPGDIYPRVMNNDLIMSRTGSRADSSIEWRFNAQTGEYMDRNPQRPMKSNPAILTWQQLQDSEEDITLLDR